jgi:hypothetical protein
LVHDRGNVIETHEHASEFTSIFPLASARRVNCRLAMSMMMFPAAFGVFLWFDVSDFDVFVGIFL